MAKRKTSIKINGRHYDALTGVLLSETPVSHAPRKSIDGVVSDGKTVKSARSQAAPVIIKPEPATGVPSSVKTMEPVKRRSTAKIHAPAAHAKTHHAKPSATLMRHAVAKPKAASLKRHAKVQGSTLATARPSHLVKITPKISFYSVNQQRLARAAAVSLSPRVSRFAHEMVITAPTAVENAMSAFDQAIVIPQTITPGKITYRPDVTPARRNQTTTSDVFERALQRAISHEQPAPLVKSSKKSRRGGRALRHRMVSYTAGAVAVLAIAGFLGMQSYDTIQFKVAANKAGFAATMPHYKPSGFAVDSVRSYDGYIGLRYVADSISGSRSYAITEKPSSWNSSTLLTNILANGQNTSYRVVEKAGRTVYIYGNNQAAWVSNGILYQLVSSGTLGNHEIGQIAASM